jgi:hypothetical protein
MKKQWNKDIRDQLKDFPKKAPEGLLDDIKAEMLRRGLSSAPVGQPRQTRSSVLFRVASVAAIALLLFGISYLWQEQSILPTTLEQAASFINSSNSSIVAETEVPESQPLVPNSSSLIAKATKKVSSDSDIPSHKEETILQVATNEEVQEKEEGKEDEQPKDNKQQKTEKEYVETSSKPKWTYNASIRKKSSISFGVYYSGIIAQVDPTMKDYAADLSSGPGCNLNDSTEVAWSRGATTTYYLTGKAAHHLPVKLGVSFRYDLDERWNLQSGLTYSYLASDISKDSYDTKQKLHYIGIPLQLGYKLGESKRFRSYIAAGFQVEKLVSGKAVTRHSKNKEPQGTFIQNISDKRLLFSILASYGVEYALGKNFSLYAEPGIHYYFKNGNGLQTHYNEQPLDLNLTIGFRFHRK